MRARLKPILGSAIAVVLAWALWVGFSRGGQDFRVFRYAGKLVLEGRWDALYSEGPDRYLYAPGFAWLVSPFAALPESSALALWLFLTVAAFGAAMRALARRLGAAPVMLAILLSMRAIAIDLRYGQVNLLILAAATWALLAGSERAESRASRRNRFAAWFVFAIAACAKVYPLALFLFPLFALDLPALAGAAAGAAFLLIPPAFAAGAYPLWLDALARKGLPTDTHNQSLLAFLVRVFGGEPFYSLGLGGEALHFPGVGLSLAATRVIWISFSLAALGGLLHFARLKPKGAREGLLIAGFGLALCFLPAHLIWKSYFVLGIPLLAALFREAADDRDFLRPAAIVSTAFLGLSLAGRDIVGPRAAAWIEAATPFLWVHLLLIATGFWRFSSRVRSS